MTDNQLKQLLAKMLPERLEYIVDTLYWCFEEIQHDRPVIIRGNRVLDTELLHLCWLVEKMLNDEQWKDYCVPLGGRNIYWEGAKQMLHATWQQRTIALAKVKGVEL